MGPETLTMDQALAALAAKAAGVIPGARSLGEHPEGGLVTVRSGRFGPYVNWGKVNANIPKSRSPDTLTLNDALELLAEREGKPVRTRAAAKAKTRAGGEGEGAAGGKSQGRAEKEGGEEVTAGPPISWQTGQL